MLVQIATALTVLIGMVGLAVDIGFVTLERRTLQNAVDAAALTGAIDLVSSPGSTQADVNIMVDTHGVASASATCAFVDNSNAETGACSGTPGSGSSGVKVSATRSRDTFFMRVLNVPTVTMSAQSIARVSAWQNYDAAAALFIVCGYQTKLAPVSGGGTYSILAGTAPGSAPWPVNSAAVGKTFVIHDPQDVVSCGVSNASFKGLNGSTEWLSLPASLEYDTGVNAGPTAKAVEGFNGCSAGVDPNNCVMVLPIAASSVPQPGQDELYCVRWLRFLITKGATNVHYGKLLDPNYVVRQQSNTVLTSWTVGTQAGLTSVRTVE